MALQHSITLDSGITCSAAYTRISAIQHTHFETLVSVQTWADAAARLSDKTPVRTGSYSLPWTDGVSLTAAYTALKGEADFTGASDV